ncbi:Endopolyphosphatase [Hortaea werneckii]|nr:Endopolyphosphatase [Hortaea werneckii]KAI7322690.1 Endopolyphosphatase [Hortaea werneckii]
MLKTDGKRAFCFVALLASSLAAPPTQWPLQAEPDAGIEIQHDLEHAETRRPLHGRFLHLTDFHPDRFYEIYSSTSSDAACHRGQGPAGIYGAEMSDCDSPIDLVNQTMAWIKEEFKDKVDFVVWTGDSARHDNDDEIPRNAGQVTKLNEFMVHKMFEVFGKHNGDEDDNDPNNDFVIPIVPNLGNNDILPHNVMTKGPNTWTRTYSRIWRQFIPEVQKHSFEQGGWFYVEVIPNKLAVFSLNTLYFFKSNAAVDGCASPREPGSQQFEWLRIQLHFMRERGVKAILTGHVPPIRQDAKTTWEESCWQKYTLWLQQYRDVVITGLYGHFNYDHFMLQDFEDLDKDTQRGRMSYYHTHDAEDSIHATVSSDYWLQLREQWSELPEPPESLKEIDDDEHVSERMGDIMPLWLERIWRQSKSAKGKDKEKQRRKKYLKKMGGKYAERFSTSFVAASVVPNLFPTVRVYDYDISGLEGRGNDLALPDPAPFDWHQDEDDDGIDLQKKKKKKKEKFYKFKVPEPPSKSSPPGPAYSSQALSLTKYRQYYANLTHINNDFVALRSDEDVGAEKWNKGKHKGKRPHDRDHEPNPRPFKYQLHYDTQEDEVYHLKDLTMSNLIDLARRVGGFVSESSSTMTSEATKKKHKKGKKKHRKGKHGKDRARQNEAWYTFIRRAFVETKDSREIEKEFGD